MGTQSVNNSSSENPKNTASENPFMAVPPARDNPFMDALSKNPFLSAPKADRIATRKVKNFLRPSALKVAVLVGLFFLVVIPIYSGIQRSREEARRETARVAELERQRIEEERKKDARIACNRQYAEKELSLLSFNSKLIKANKEGSGDVFSTRQGTPYSDTFYHDDYATTYYHDGSYSSLDGIRISYRIKNNSQFLIYKEIAAKTIYYTKSGSFWSGAAGATAGAAAVASASDDIHPLAILAGMAVGSMAGRALLAGNTEEFKIYPDLLPGQEYSGSQFISTTSGEDKSAMEILNIKAVIYDNALRDSVAPGCGN